MSDLEVNVVDDRRRARGVRLRADRRRGNGLSPDRDSAERAAQERPPRRSARGPVQTVGGEPRVDLLPSEVHTEQRAAAVARRAWLAVVVFGAVVLLGVGAATTEGVRARSDLARSQSNGASVLQEQLRFNDVRAVQRDTELLKAAQAVGGSAQIDWSGVLGSLASALPAGTTVTGLTIASMDPVKGFAQSTEPLASSRVATLDITISSATVPSVPDLSDRLTTVQGYAGARIAAIASAGDSGAYSGQITLDLDSKAFDETYVPEKGE